MSSGLSGIHHGFTMVSLRVHYGYTTGTLRINHGLTFIQNRGGIYGKSVLFLFFIGVKFCQFE